METKTACSEAKEHNMTSLKTAISGARFLELLLMGCGEWVPFQLHRKPYKQPVHVMSGLKFTWGVGRRRLQDFGTWLPILLF